MVPDSVAPETCARSGVAENRSPRAQINTRILVAFDFIAVPPVWYKDFFDIQHTHSLRTVESDRVCSTEASIKMSAPWGVDPSESFHASTGSRGSMLAGKKGNTHVVPPKCQIAKQP